MTELLAKLAPWRWSTAVGLMVLLLAWGAAERHGRVRVTETFEQSRIAWGVERQRAADAAEQQREAHRAESRRREAAHLEIVSELETRLASARAELDAARAAQRGLRQQSTALAAAASAAARDSCTAEAAEAIGAAARMHADVLARVDERAGVLATFADAARAGWQGCVGAYDALKPSEP